MITYYKVMVRIVKSKFKIGIVGGAGYIGHSLAQFLLSKNYKVIVLDIRLPKKKFEGVVYRYCDIRRQEQLEKALKGLDLVIHTAIVQIPQINEQKELGYEVNILGLQNVCDAVAKSPNIKGLILAGSWHVFGEHNLRGTIDEEYGYRPDKVEERARLYAISKVAQETIVRFYDEMLEKIFGIIRMGTVLGEGMPKKTAANIFIEQGLRGESITPYSHSMYRPMFYVDIYDVCKAFERFAAKILSNEIEAPNKSSAHIVNVCYPEPVTIMELAQFIQRSIIKHSKGKIRPKIEIIDTKQPPLFNKEDKYKVTISIERAKKLLGFKPFKSPWESIEEIIVHRMAKFTKTIVDDRPQVL